MTGLAVCTLLLLPAAPVPMTGGPAPAPTNSQVDPAQVTQFATLVENLANLVCDKYVRASLTQKELYSGAIRGLYDAVGQPVPKDVQKAINNANNQLDRIAVLREVRTQLGNHPNLAGARSLFAAMNGFKYATDPTCGLASPRVNQYASIDQDFGIGIELEGVVGTRWAIYQVEHRIAMGLIPPTGYFGKPPKPEEVPSPAAFPWHIQRVIPGSPAQKSGIRPGDIITHVDGVEINAGNVNKMFARFAVPRRTFDQQTGQPSPREVNLTLRRGEDKPFTVTLDGGTYTPESAFGVMRTADDQWDCLLDRKARIGYIRLGPIEQRLDAAVAEMMEDLTRRGCRALILDLRWCPGGYVQECTRIAGLFLPDGAIISKMIFTHPEDSGPGGDILAMHGGGKHTKMPLVVLVGRETMGGGELIASALRDNDRCVIMGQRTVGRATIQNVSPAGFAGLQFRVTTGTSLRPNGKNRQRTPESQPTDDWGVRPDEGLEVPVTADKSAELRRQAELHGLRPAGSLEALPFDDPAADPFRLAALHYFRARLGPLK